MRDGRRGVSAGGGERTSFANRQSSEGLVVREGSDGTWSRGAASLAFRGVGVCVNELSTAPPRLCTDNVQGLKSWHRFIEQS